MKGRQSAGNPDPVRPRMNSACRRSLRGPTT